VFSMFLSSRAVPATPGERLGASAERLPEPCGLRIILRCSASPLKFTRLHLSLLRATARDFAAGGLPTPRHTGPASAGCLAASRRGPRYPIAQRFIGVGSFHPTRNTPLSRRTKTHLAGTRHRSYGCAIRAASPGPHGAFCELTSIGLVRGAASRIAAPLWSLRTFSVPAVCVLESRRIVPLSGWW